jgi:hypothetical protein
VIDGNEIDCVNDDGFGPGGYGIRISAGHMPGMRVRCTGNNIRGAMTSGIVIEAPGTPANPNGFVLLELADNLAWDNQAVPTCLNAIEFKTPLNLGKLVLHNNIKGDGVANGVVGLTSGVWLTSDGDPPEWVGYGSPEGVVSAKRGSRFMRRDASGPSLYVKESDAGTTGNPMTGWIAK